jgi:hypothetical protein
MKNVISYVEKYGDKTFKEKSIGEIDYAILSILSYINYDGILFSDKTKVTLGEALNKFFNKYTDKELSTHGLGLKDSYKIAKSLMNTNRFKDLDLYNYIYVTDDKIQFSAMFIDISDKETFISIEGTDDEVVGWKEDFQMSYQFPIPSQKKCVEYLNKNISVFTEKKYVVGGHSKGGNLALVGCMYLPFIKNHKIKEIYSFDGPGLGDKQIRSHRYLTVKDKYNLVIPNYSIVGILLNNKVERKIVSSYRKGIYAHSVINWRVTDDKFFEAEELSPFSKYLESTVIRWVHSYNLKTRRKFVEDLFDIFDRCNIKTLYKIHAKDLKEISTVAREAKNISPETKKLLKDFIKMLLDTVKEDTFSFIKK